MINYKTTPEWDREVFRLTNGLGVDHVVEVGGAGTLPRSINATRMEGLISLIGVLARGDGVDPMKILMKGLRVKGILVGSREMFEQMNRAITESKLKPVIDKTFTFDQVAEALKYLKAAPTLGKLSLRSASRRRPCAGPSRERARATFNADSRQRDWRESGCPLPRAERQHLDSPGVRSRQSYNCRACRRARTTTFMVEPTWLKKEASKTSAGR